MVYLVPFLFLIFVTHAEGRDFRTEFLTRMQSTTPNDPALDQSIADWQVSHPDDPDLFYARAALQIARSHISLGIDLPPDTTEGPLTVHADSANPRQVLIKNSAGKTVGSMYETIDWDRSKLAKAAPILQEGIRRFPSRLEMRYLLADVYQRCYGWDSSYAAIRGMVDYAMKPGSTEPVVFAPDTIRSPESELPFYLQKFTSLCRQTEADSALDLVERVCELCVDRFPRAALCYDCRGRLLADRGRWEESRRAFQEAIAHDSTDVITLWNLATASRRVSDFERAKSAYRQILRHTVDVKRIERVRAALEELDAR